MEEDALECAGDIRLLDGVEGVYICLRVIFFQFIPDHGEATAGGSFDGRKRN